MVAACKRGSRHVVVGSSAAFSQRPTPEHYKKKTEGNNNEWVPGHAGPADSR
jgi:hypothetical protein